MTFDLLPWETTPQAPQAVETIEWNGGKLSLPRLGYLTVDELQGIRAIDPSNALYRLTADTSVALSRAAEDQSPRQCFALLTALHGRDLGAAVALTPDQKAIEMAHAAIIAPFLEQAKTITNRVVVRSVTMILQRVRPDWTDDQTRRLPAPLLSLLHAFEQEEERGSGQGDPAAEMRALEEALGKLQHVASTATDPTGSEPSGTAAASGPVRRSSAASGSARSPAGTSSRRSKKAIAPSANGFTAKS